MHRAALAVILLVAFAAPALAQPLARALMGAAEARRTFLGIDMEGVHQPSGERWRECIDRGGKTTYWFAGTVDEGRLTIRDDGALCFAYASRGFRDSACWRIRQQGRGAYRFESVIADEPGVFVTNRTRRVNACEGPAPAIS